MEVCCYGVLIVCLLVGIFVVVTGCYYSLAPGSLLFFIVNIVGIVVRGCFYSLAPDWQLIFYVVRDFFIV